MTFYSNVIILTELLLLTMTLHVLNYSGFKKEQKAWYIATFLAIMLCAGAEFAVHGLPYDSKFAIPLTILTVLQFSLSPILGVLFIGALGMPKQGRVAFIFLAISFTVEVIAAPFGWIFKFTETEYVRGNGFFIYGIFYFSSLLYLVVNMVLVGRRFRHRDVWTIGMVLVILVAGIIPMTVYNINITYIAVAIGASICYIYYNDLVQQDIKAELVAEQAKISTMQEHMISGLANLVENRDMDTGGHISRTSAYVKILAENARKDGVYTDKLTDEFIAWLYALAPMHDIGKVIIPDSILKKPGKLTPEEFEQMKKHASYGGSVVKEVLSGITDEAYLSFAADIATYHHEKWDGNGYPKGLKYEEIPLSARIMAIADVYDALVSERCYKKPVPPDEAAEIIHQGAGSHFDPNLVKVFVAHKEDFEMVLKNDTSSQIAAEEVAAADGNTAN